MIDAKVSLDERCTLGTRKSILARWQTDHVAGLLAAAWPSCKFAVETFNTQGDRDKSTPLPEIGGKGLFTLELENALRGGAIDIAVHSLKDLPTDSPDGIAVGAVPLRENPADALVSRENFSVDTLPRGATVGTSSRRRAAQLLCARPDLKVIDIRGNVDTRLAKALDPAGAYDAIVLAYSGLLRLDRSEVVSQILPFDIMLPAPGQGALGVQCRDEVRSLDFVAPIDHGVSAQAVLAERAFLAALGGGCSLPVAAFGEIVDDRLHVHGRVSAPDGSRQIDVSIDGSVDEAQRLGAELAKSALGQGAAEYI